jgi:hypothetical protein
MVGQSARTMANFYYHSLDFTLKFNMPILNNFYS